MISNPVASELLILLKARTRQCRVPTIDRGRDTALPCPVCLKIKNPGFFKKPGSIETIAARYFLRGLMERHTYENLIAGKALEDRKQKYQFRVAV